MRNGIFTRRIAALLVLAFALAGGAAATGAGGLLFGLAEPGLNPDFMPGTPADLPELEFMGGFGYGVDHDGFIVGGFGLAFLDDTIYDAAYWDADGPDAVPVHAAGGVGGMVLGSRVVGWSRFHLDLALRAGLGGLGIKRLEGGAYAPEGYFIGYLEPYVEAGIGLVSWLHLGATLSYPIIANLIPGRPGSDLLWYSPSLGITVSFGEFGSW